MPNDNHSPESIFPASLPGMQTFGKTETEIGNQVFIYPPEIGVLGQAKDLYMRGWNVIPLPRGKDWRERAKPEKIAAGKVEKKAFLLGPFFLRRLHYCGDIFCRHVKSDFERFERLFFKPFTGEPLNLGVILGRTSGNLTQIDCDTFEAYLRMGEELRRRGLPYWAIRSARGGSYFLRCLEGEIANTGKTTFDPEVEIWGCDRFAVLPPSEHWKITEHGEIVMYRWEKDNEPRGRVPDGENLSLVSIQNLEWLGAELAQKERRQNLPGAAGLLSFENQTTLSYGIVDGEGRNKKLTALYYDIASFVQSGDITYQDARGMVLVAADKCTPAYDHEKALGMFKAGMDKPREHARQCRQTRADIPGIDFVSSFDWTGTFGGRADSVRRVFMLCCDTAIEHGLPFRASVRYVADRLGMSSNTSRLALANLKKARVIHILGMDKATRSLEYDFGEACKSATITTKTVNIVAFLHEPKTEGEKLIFTGRYIFGVYRLLLEKPLQTFAEIDRMLGLSTGSARRAIIYLRKFGLVDLSGGDNSYFSIPVTEGDLLAIARQNGKLEKQERRKESFEKERGTYPNRRMTSAIFKYYGRIFSTKKQKNTEIITEKPIYA